MLDRYNRKIEYLRISITDRCNLHCKYCVPDVAEHLPREEILTDKEILTVVKTATELGIRYIKITGGEPLVRNDFIDIIRQIKSVSGIEKVTVTTNGVKLGDYIEPLADVGIDGINISLDTLDRRRYEEITGFDRLETIVANIKKVCKYDIPIKINTVVMPDTDWDRMITLAREYPVCVRFIEMMPIGLGKNSISKGTDILSEIKKKYPHITRNEAKLGVGPAAYYDLPGFKGSIGFIQPMHNKFCNACNRVRLTSTGYLKTCLCYDTGADLRDIVRNNPSQLKMIMEHTIYNKPKEHCFENCDMISEKNNMSAIGG